MATKRARSSEDDAGLPGWETFDAPQDDAGYYTGEDDCGDGEGATDARMSAAQSAVLHSALQQAGVCADGAAFADADNVPLPPSAMEAMRVVGSFVHRLREEEEAVAVSNAAQRRAKSAALDAADRLLTAAESEAGGSVALGVPHPDGGSTGLMYIRRRQGVRVGSIDVAAAVGALGEMLEAPDIAARALGATELEMEKSRMRRVALDKLWKSRNAKHDERVRCGLPPFKYMQTRPVQYGGPVGSEAAGSSGGAAGSGASVDDFEGEDAEEEALTNWKEVASVPEHHPVWTQGYFRTAVGALVEAMRTRCAVAYDGVEITSTQPRKKSSEALVLLHETGDAGAAEAASQATRAHQSAVQAMRQTTAQHRARKEKLERGMRESKREIMRCLGEAAETKQRAVRSFLQGGHMDLRTVEDLGEVGDFCATSSAAVCIRTDDGREVLVDFAVRPAKEEASRRTLQRGNLPSKAQHEAVIAGALAAVALAGGVKEGASARDVLTDPSVIARVRDVLPTYMSKVAGAAWKVRHNRERAGDAYSLRVTRKAM